MRENLENATSYYNISLVDQLEKIQALDKQTIKDLNNLYEADTFRGAGGLIETSIDVTRAFVNRAVKIDILTKRSIK